MSNVFRIHLAHKLFKKYFDVATYDITKPYTLQTLFLKLSHEQLV